MSENSFDDAASPARVALLIKLKKKIEKLEQSTSDKAVSAETLEALQAEIEALLKELSV
jgi:hypothetical protein